MRERVDNTCNGQAMGKHIDWSGEGKNGDDEADEIGRSQVMGILNGKEGWHGQSGVSERWNNANGKRGMRPENLEGKCWQDLVTDQCVRRGEASPCHLPSRWHSFSM